MQPSEIAVELRPRTPWEAIDLGLAMLQRWWQQAYSAHGLVLSLVVVLAVGTAWSLERPWIALAAIWWLKPLYDRVVLHVLSRAVFGELQGVRATLGDAREWLGSGLFMALTFDRFDLARSFNLPVAQLEGGRGREGRARRSVLGRRARGHAVWLSIVCLHFEGVLYWSLHLLASMLLPASSVDTRDVMEALIGGTDWSYADILAYAAAVLILEPFYVAAGFALYLNRRTLLEGWDLEVALRRLAARAAPVVLLLVIGALPLAALAQKDPKAEIAEVLKAPEFGYEREALRWVPRASEAKEPAPPEAAPDFSFVRWLAKLAQFALWAVVAAAIAYMLWWMVRALPRHGAPPVERYQAPASLFGMDLAPQTLPADVPAAVLQLVREGKPREALALLYRGALSRLVHQRGVELHASHTEMEVLALAPSDYLRQLITAWRACAYADRVPSAQAIEQLTKGYASL
ncbi:MAG TPA: DUF4129 domain-containing protein [Burkholderiales bacterium]|nr:DUF4129 domain-containing protein [Burkholderiales bacterium]